nr:DddA-like double-stranded DNA deaminase toxin [Kribbella italica]
MSELQRVAQGLVDSLNEIPRVIAALDTRARICRDHAAIVMQLSGGSATMAAQQLDAAARACEGAAHYLSLAPPKAHGWAQQMVDGIRTAGPTGDGAARRPDAPGGSMPPADRRPDDDQAEPEGGKLGKAAGSGDEASPEDEPSTLGTSDEEAWRLFGKLPVRDESKPVRQKTRGIWRDDDGTEQPLISGQLASEGEGDDPYYQQVKAFMRQRRIGRQDGEPMVASHVESKFAMFMRERGLTRATIAVNKLPCTGDLSCDDLLPQFLPAGGTLTVFGPAGFKKTYRGLDENGHLR